MKETGRRCSGQAWFLRTARIEALRRHLAAGLQDTAELYGWGNSERLLGGCARNSPSSHPVIATKFTPMFRWSKDSLQKALRKSLARLGLARVDLYQMHQMDGLKNIPSFSGS